MPYAHALCSMPYALCVRTLIVADVHANLAAFEAVIAQAEAMGAIDAIWCLGDLVGYGAEPGECIALLRSYPHRAIAGNHDLVACGVMGTEDFNRPAAMAAEWTLQRLTEDEQAFLRALPLTLVEADFTLVHGSLRDPVWDYLISDRIAETHLEQQPTPYCLVGHSHLPLVFYEGGRHGFVQEGLRLRLGAERFVANPGGLGQPRDGDPRAAYAVLDLDARELTFHRAAYDIEATQAKIRDAGLPPILADRLSQGR